MKAAPQTVRPLQRLSIRGPISALALALPLCCVSQELFHLKWRESGIHDTIRGFRPHAAQLSTEAPAAMKKAPPGLEHPFYGSFDIGSAKAPNTVLLILDRARDGNHKLFLDTNGNGDFTDDPPCTTEMKPYKTREGDEAKAWHAQGKVVIPFTSGPRTGTLNFYTAESAPPQADFRKVIFYYSDYGLAGEVKIGDRTVAAALDDAACSGEFRISHDTMATPIFWLDLPSGARANGRTFPASRPFEVDGKWWVMTNLTAEGAFAFAPTAKPEPRKQAEGPDLSPGKKAPAFAARLVDGKPVKFPQDYKGKVVLLDFWATWCGPCVKEIPNVVKVYKDKHARGFEVLGVSLDREQWEEKLTAFTKKREMPWPQVYDGKFWQAEVAKLYGIRSIPRMILVDGDTGTILADGDGIRGEALAPAIEKGLTGKKL